MEGKHKPKAAAFTRSATGWQIEIKSCTSGKMKSLRYFMEKKNVDCAIRSSLENFGRLNVVIDEKECSIDIVPLYAIASVVGRESVGAVFDKLFNP